MLYQTFSFSFNLKFLNHKMIQTVEEEECVTVFLVLTISPLYCSNFPLYSICCLWAACGWKAVGLSKGVRQRLEGS